MRAYYSALLFAALSLGSLFPVEGAASDAPERPGREELLSNQVRIDEEGLKARGELKLHGLSPLSVELRLEEAEGEGPRLARLLGKLLRLSGAGEGAARLPIQWLRIESGAVRITPKGTEGEARRMAIPEGSLSGLFMRSSPDGGWRAHGETLTLKRIPEAWGFPLPLTGCGFSDLALTGHREPGSQRARVEAVELHCDGAKARNVVFTGTESGARPGVWLWQSELPSLELDMARVRSLTRRQPELAKETQATLARLGLEALWGLGKVRLTDVNLRGEAGRVTAKKAETALEGGFGVRGDEDRDLGRVALKKGKARWERTKEKPSEG